MMIKASGHSKIGGQSVDLIDIGHCGEGLELEDGIGVGELNCLLAAVQD